MPLDLPEPTLSTIRQAQSLAATGDVTSAASAYRDLLDRVGDDDYQAAAVLHMYAIVVADPHRKLGLNEDALRRAERSGRFPPPLFATLLANVGYSYRELGDDEAARNWYVRAQEAAAGLDDDEYGRNVRAGIDAVLASLTSMAS